MHIDDAKTSPEHMTTITIPAPQVLLAEVTHRCPLQCPYCSNPTELIKKDVEISTADWARVFKEAADLGVLQVSISGGEPAARRDLTELIRAARDADLYVNRLLQELESPKADWTIWSTQAVITSSCHYKTWTPTVPN